MTIIKRTIQFSALVVGLFMMVVTAQHAYADFCSNNVTQPCTQSSECVGGTCTIRNALDPGEGTPSAALNTGPNTQQRVGSLIIGPSGGISKICLNALNNGDAANCVTNWSQLSTDKFVTIRSTSLPILSNGNGYATEPVNYSRQSGYSDITAGSISRHFTATVLSSETHICVRDYTDQSDGRCSNSGEVCQANSDCQSNGSGYFGGTAVYGASNGSATSFAGYFGGTVLVSAPSQYVNYNFGSLGRICLGNFEPPYADPSGGACISSWNEVTTAPPAYVQLQTSNPLVTQPNSGAAISGSSVFGSAVVGTPIGDLTGSCGNGMCDPSTGENSTSCPIDCAIVPTPVNFDPQMSSSASLANLLVDLPITTLAQQPTTAKVLIVRSQNTAPTFRPVNGVNYTVGLNVGGNQVIVAIATTTAGASLQLSDTLLARGTYYYQAYQSNIYPRYSAPTAAMPLTPMVLTTVISPDSSATILSEPPGIICGFGSTDCVALYNVGTNVTVSIEALASGWRVNNWTGCDSWNLFTCTVSMTQDKSVSTNLTRTGGGGGAP